MGWRARTNFVLPSAVVAPSGTRRQHEEHRDEDRARCVLYGDQTRTGDVWVLGPSGSYSFRDMRPWEGEL